MKDNLSFHLGNFLSERWVLRDCFTEFYKVRGGDYFVIVYVVHLEDKADSLIYKFAE